MAAQIKTQISGENNLGPAEVELNNSALRVHVMPEDQELFGYYQMATRTTPFSAGTGGINGVVGLLVLGEMGNVAVVKQITVSFLLTSAGTGSAGQVTINLVRGKLVTGASPATISGTGANQGTVISPMNSMMDGRKRDSMAIPNAVAIQLAGGTTNTGLVSSAGGAIFTEPFNLATVTFFQGTSVSPTQTITNLDLWNTGAGDVPIVLTSNWDALAITIVQPASSTAQTTDISCLFRWHEMTSYP